MQTFRDYHHRQNPRLTHEQWAERLGISRPYVTGLLNGTMFPSSRVIGLIAELTGGEVSPNSWYQPYTQDAPDAAPVAAGAGGVG